MIIDLSTTSYFEKPSLASKFLPYCMHTASFLEPSGDPKHPPDVSANVEVHVSFFLIVVILNTHQMFLPMWKCQLLHIIVKE